MQTRLLGFLVVMAFTLVLSADDTPTQLNATMSKAPTDLNDPRWWELRGRKAEGISLGKSDYTLGGPLAETFRGPSWSQNEGPWTRKLLRLPIVNLFVPIPMPKAGVPPGSPRGKYFAWGESDAPWSTISTRERGGSSGGLLSIRW